MADVRVPHDLIALHGGGVTLACALDGGITADEAHGLFAWDTRVLSSYHLAVEGQSWQMLGRWNEGHESAHWQFQNRFVHAVTGDLAPGSLQLTVRRRVHGGMHDDLVVRSFAPRRVRVRFIVHVDADFSDIFEVKAGSMPPRLAIHRDPTPNGQSLHYEHRGFRRGLDIEFESDSPRSHVGALTIFDLDLRYGEEWHCCIDARPQADGERMADLDDPHAPEPAPSASQLVPRLSADPLLARPFEVGRADLRALAARDGDTVYVAAGVPWFQTVFGRDQLVTGLMSGIDGAWIARGGLSVLGGMQAAARDDWRDAEPGKLPHELRRGELVHSGRMPHAPYYGTHDTPALYCLALWDAWRWTGDPGLLDAHLRTARAAIEWCDRLGDRDGDGLQEYETRSSAGYYNQGWKDAGDAIVEADGSLAPTPLATVELQGYLFAAKLALADLLEARNDPAEARRLRESAAALRTRIEERFWLVDEDCYGLAVDGRKRLVRSVASNQAHLLWCGVPDPERAARVADRLLAPDMFSGWGLRTLSSDHPAYNPLAYQTGSVWPHDTLLAAAGLWRYGLHEQASRLLRSVLDAANAFDDARLPEVFCGFSRDESMPMPYYQANRPQAWAAAAPVLAAQLLLGIVPDAPHGRCYIAPDLPEWLPSLALEGLSVGEGRVSITASRHGAETRIDDVHAEGIEVFAGVPPAPLWGLPLGGEGGR